MKNFRKITASFVLASMFLLNVPTVNSEWIHKTEYLHHSPMWLASKEVRSATKDKQLCKIATSFDILNEDWTVKYTYYPQGCQPKTVESIFHYNGIDSNNQDEDWVNGFIKWLFFDWSEETDFPRETDWSEETDWYEETDSEYEYFSSETDKINNTDGLDFVDGLFWNTSDLTEDETEFSSASEEPDDSTTSDDSIQDADDILKEIFWKTNGNINTSLKGSKLISTIRKFSESKIKIRVGNIEANVLSNDMNYNSKVANLLKQIDEEFKINSFKNDFAKKIWKVSYSLSTYKNTTDLETKKVFRNKLINDIKKLQKSYKVLKKKDRIISKILEKRGQL